MLTIKRNKDKRIVKCILHRVADIPGGVTVNVANLGGNDILEGTPIAKGSNGLFEVVKTAQIVSAATATATTYEVAKGHHFKVGDRFATDSCNGQTITAIDKTDSAKDVITVGTTLGAAIAIGTCAFESAGANKTLKHQPVAITGSNYTIDPNSNLFIDAWVIGVVREGNAPSVNASIKTALKGLIYV